MELNLKKTSLTFEEVDRFISNVVNSVFIESEDGTVNYVPMLKYTSKQANFVETYTDYTFVEDFDTNYQVYMSLDIDEFITNKCEKETGKFINRVQWNFIENSINQEIEFKKQQLLHNKKSSMDEAFEELSKLLQTLNTKAEQLDMKKLEKVLKKLNPNEVIKAYQKSNIGNDVRDKAIHEQAQTIINLKNEISARNVKA